MAISELGRKALELIVRSRGATLKHPWIWLDPLNDPTHGNMQELIDARLVRHATTEELGMDRRFQEAQSGYVWALTDYGVAVAALLKED